MSATPTVADVERIAALDDPVLRNLQITGRSTTRLSSSLGEGVVLWHRHSDDNLSSPLPEEGVARVVDPTGMAVAATSYACTTRR